MRFLTQEASSLAFRRKNPYVFYTDRKKHHGRAILRFILILILILIAAGFALAMVSAHDLQYIRQQITIPNLPAEMEGFAILHLSDLHGRKDQDMVNRIQNYVKNRTWSCLVMTGDMIGKEADPEGVLRICSLFPQDMPKFLILGDEDPDYLVSYAHENLTPFAEWALRLQQAGIVILDEPVLITRGAQEKARLWIVPESLYTLDLGMMQWTYAGRLKQWDGQSSYTPDEEAQKRVAEYQADRVERILSKVGQMQEGDIQIALTHVPVTEQEVRQAIQDQDRNGIFSYRKISMILAGHYCAGQWRIPGKGPVFVPELGWFPEDSLVNGIGYPGGIQQYISPGLGVSEIYPYQPFRFLNPASITSIELTARMV